MNINSKEIIKEVLDTITEIISINKIELSTKLSDGRLNSAKNEDEIIEFLLHNKQVNDLLNKHNLLMKTPNLENENNREWYDFCLESKCKMVYNIFCPINLKVSLIDKAADNLSCKLGIFYALTGIEPSTINLNNGVDWEKFMEALDTYMGENNDKDYYFLVVNKKDTSDVFWNSLKCLEELVPNGNNLPFQCKWDKNRNRIERSEEEARKFILSHLVKSVELRSNIQVSSDKHLKKYIK